MRRKTRKIKIGGVYVGGDAPVTVQSMTNTDTADVTATLAQIHALTALGCEIIRVAVPDIASAKAIAKIKKEITIPLIADIHFDYKLALASVDAGADGLRLNPGNIGSTDRIREVVKAAVEKKLPIRIGVNAGSLEKDLLAKYGHPTKEALTESALRHIRILEDFGFNDIKVSIKASNVPLTIAAYRLLAQQVDYPFHIGITEAGTCFSGSIKSAVGLGILLSDGIGDTLRVSLTGDPLDEVKTGWEILKALEIRKRGATIISCPTCGRIKFDGAGIAIEIEKRLSHVKESIKVAVMGCVVNGPGEAIEADVGVAGGDGVGLIYVKGAPLKKVQQEFIVDTVIEEVMKIIEERKI
jgi:(E)-4-hydroxy-3-methylbut-2-enyl-diphosphate synthase